MADFTLTTFHRLLTALKSQDYTFQTFTLYLKVPAPKVIILRHDVDKRHSNSLRTAQIENQLGLTGTYYFRIAEGSFDEKIIRQISDLGHEIGYHYEDLSRCASKTEGIKVLRRDGVRAESTSLTEEKLADLAIISFRENLARLRRIAPVETICMHGSPVSGYDNRKLWKRYNYHDFGIFGEPYFDVNFNEVLYLTDTGRCWDAGSFNIRDKVIHPEPYTPHLEPINKFRSTFEIIRVAGSGTLPDKIMITFHPQRWDGRPVPWLSELIWQNLKNQVKRIINLSPKKSL